VRSLALELRPAILEIAGLDGTLRWLAEQHQQRTGMPTHVVGRLTDDVLGDVATACFRVAQQALTNVVQHARARQVWIELSQDSGRLELAIRDDGVGFDVSPALEHAPSRGHLGLLGMKERVQNVGGTLHIDSEPSHGTRIRALFLLARTTKQAFTHVE
jgi:signal transduction histidine kinase